MIRVAIGDPEHMLALTLEHLVAGMFLPPPMVRCTNPCGHRKALVAAMGWLAEALGLTFQQVQKYERGANRISSSRLYDLARVLDVPIEHFFDDMPTAVAASSPTLGGGRAKKPPSYEFDPMAKRETLELVRAYYKISDPRVRNRLREMVKALGAASENQQED